MAIFSIALRGWGILEEFILSMSLSGSAILHCTLRKLVHFKKGAHANDESLTKVVDFW